MRHVVVLGFGLAGYHATRRIEDKLTGRRRVQLTVVDRRDRFIFSPLLTSVASGEIDPDHIAVDVDDVVAPGTETVIADVDAIDFDDRRIFAGDREIPFDYLLLAPGRHQSPAAFDGADTLVGPHTLGDAVTIRQRLESLQAATDPSQHRFAIVGASTTGVEWAAELATSPAGRRSDSQGEPSIELLESNPRILPDHSPKLAENVDSYLRKIGVRIRTDCTVRSATSNSIELDDGSTIDVAMAFHCAGRIGDSRWATSGLPVDARGRIRVEPDLRVPDVSGVFGCGAAAAAIDGVPDNSDPQIAAQQGDRAARNLVAAMSGRTLKPFEFDHRGDFITLGRDHTAVELGDLFLEGRAAWLAYRLYYTALMPKPIEKTRLVRDWLSRRLVGDGRAVERLESE